MKNQATPKNSSSSRDGQISMFYNAQCTLARENQTFLVLVQSGMTKSDLKRNIEKRPSLWKKYEHWMEKLPEIRP